MALDEQDSSADGEAADEERQQQPSPSSAARSGALSLGHFAGIVRAADDSGSADSREASRLEDAQHPVAPTDQDASAALAQPAAFSSLSREAGPDPDTSDVFASANTSLVNVLDISGVAHLPDDSFVDAMSDHVVLVEEPLDPTESSSAARPVPVPFEDFSMTSEQGHSALQPDSATVRRGNNADDARGPATGFLGRPARPFTADAARRATNEDSDAERARHRAASTGAATAADSDEAGQVAHGDAAASTPARRTVARGMRSSTPKRGRRHRSAMDGGLHEGNLSYENTGRASPRRGTTPLLSPPASAPVPGRRSIQTSGGRHLQEEAGFGDADLYPDRMQPDGMAEGPVPRRPRRSSSFNAEVARSRGIEQLDRFSLWNRKWRRWSSEL